MNEEEEIDGAKSKTSPWQRIMEASMSLHMCEYGKRDHSGLSFHHQASGCR
jgi:hypothetical protein